MTNIKTIMATKRQLLLPVIIIAAFFVLFPLTGRSFYMHVCILMFLNITLALGYRLGYVTGLGSFCHITFFALGAYTSAIMTVSLGVPWGVGFICGGLVAAALAALFAWPTVRARGPYFFVLSFGFFVVVDTIITQWAGLTGGQGGIRNIPPIMGLTGVMPYYYIVLVFTALIILFMWRLDRSRFGRELMAVGDADNLAEVTGINVDRHRIIAFAIGAFIAGLGGSIYAHYLGFISPLNFGLFATLYILIWVVLGGERKLWGPIAGAVMMTSIAEGTRSSGTLQALIYAGILLAVIMAMPQGIVGLVDTIRVKRAQRKGVLDGNP